MKIKTRMICAVLAVMLILAVLTGCRMEHYTRDEIVEWAQANIADDVVVSEEAFARESEGCDDVVWTACRKSLPEVEFEIMSHRFYGGESLNFTIESTCWYEYGKHYFEQYKAEHETALVHLDDGLYTGSYRLLASFGNRSELSDIVAQAAAVEKYMCELGGEKFTSFKFVYNDVLAQVSETDVSEFSSGLETLDEVEEELLYELAFYAADYRLALDMFTVDELEEAVLYFDSRFAVTRADGSEVSYSDIALSRYGYGMSFGALYEVLSREGFAVSGTPEAFAVNGINGSVYEFSYSYNDMPFENGKYGYYYIKDGEKIAMPYYFYNHIESDLFNEICAMTFRRL